MPPPPMLRIPRHEERIQALRRRRFPLHRLVRANVRDVALILHESRLGLSAFILLMAGTTGYFRWIWADHLRSERSPFTVLTALYQSVRMLAFENDLPLPEEDVAGQVLFFAVPFLGLALIFQSVLNLGRYVLDKSARREGWQRSLAATFRGHVVVCGLGRVGYRVIVELLEARVPVVAIERDPACPFLSEVRELRVPVILGDATERESLLAAGVERARGAFAGTDDDLANIEMCLAARRIRADLNVVVRVFDEDLDSHLDRTFGPGTGFSTSALAATTLASAAVAPGVFEALPTPAGTIGLAAIRIGNGTAPGLSPGAIESTFGVRVLRDGAPALEGRGSRRDGSDSPSSVVVAAGPPPALRRLAAAADPSAVRPDIAGPIIVCGAGNVGFRTVRELSRLPGGPSIVVICREDSDPRFLDAFARLSIRVVKGDARRPEVLDEAGVAGAECVLAVTNSDLVNIQIALTARRGRAGLRVVARVFPDILAERLEEIFGLDAAFSTSALAAPTLAAAVAFGAHDPTIELFDGLYGIRRVRLEAPPAGDAATAGAADALAGGTVLSVLRAGVALPPTAALLAGDELVALARCHAGAATQPCGHGLSA